jgi:hypothetical protein
MTDTRGGSWAHKLAVAMSTRDKWSWKLALLKPHMSHAALPLMALFGQDVHLGFRVPSSHVLVRDDKNQRHSHDRTRCIFPKRERCSPSSRCAHQFRGEALVCVSSSACFVVPLKRLGKEFGHDTWKRKQRCHNDPSVCWAQPTVLT